MRSRAEKLLILLLPCFSFGGFSQGLKQNKGPASAADNLNCDCPAAIHIAVTSATSYFTLNKAEQGYGKVQEISSAASSDPHSFEKEHASSWYILEISEKGELVLDIHPEGKNTDCDFLIYKYSDSLTCDAIRNKKVMPVRSNIAFNKERSFTGLSASCKEKFAGKDQGTLYSKALEVSSGEKYVLVIDNASNAKGYSFMLSFSRKITIKGTVKDSLSNGPSAVSIVLLDEDKNEIAQAETNPADGTYSITTGVNSDRPYYLVFYNATTFPEGAYVNTRLGTDFTYDKKMQPLGTKAPYTLHYYKKSGQGLLQYEAWVALYRAYMLYKLHPALRMQVGCSATKDESWVDEEMPFSKWRTNNFALQLVNIGIPADRISQWDPGISAAVYSETEKQNKGRGMITVLSY
ncbi:MAG: hypothetical protein JWO09_3483 [Bacteroidetes bacterium]|nr:hypothetical protein [Bacteroidota bacterium]